MQNCGIRNGGMGHEFDIALFLVGIKVVNHPRIIKYILFFKAVSLKIVYRMCPLLPSNRNKIDSANKPIFHKCLVARQPWQTCTC